MKRNIVVILAVLPFFSVFLHHYLAVPDGKVATGFVNYEMPYYVAQGREIFEAGGNGILYANAYYPESPSIYFHWLLWLYGFGVKILKIEPGIVFLFFGVIFGLLMSEMTYRLVQKVLPHPGYQNLLFLLVMWGGGLLVATAILTNISDGSPLLYDLLRYDPGGGTWFLSWGRNMVFGTEALYHLLVAAIWLSLLQNRWRTAILCVFLLASTHPFSGIQFLLIVTAYAGLQFIQKRWTFGLVYPAVLSTGSLVFLGYYFVFLNSFESHRSVSETWTLDWTLPASSAILAYLLVGVLSIRRVLADRHALTDGQWLFLVSFGVSFLLVNHHYFITPHQPLHFTRGYVWTPLALLALPELQKIFVGITQRTKPLIASLTIATISILLTLDNIGFVYTTWSQHQECDMYLSKDEHQMYDWLDENEVSGVLLYPNSQCSSYLSATFTEMYPYLGHWALTPDYLERGESVLQWWHEGGSPAWLDDIDYLIIDPDTLPARFESDRWQEIYRAGDLVLLQQEQ